MLKEYEKIYYEVEEKHWWNVARREMILKIMQSYNPNTRSKVLDIGCSSGHLINKIEELTHAEVYGIDVSERAIQSCRRNGILNTEVMNGNKLEFNNASFDYLVASDCLEHIDDDVAALKEWNRVIKKGGKLIIFVPAFMALWSVQDNISEHYRRYKMVELQRKLRTAGFRVNRISYWNVILFFPIFIYRSFLKLVTRKISVKDNQLTLPTPYINQFFLSLLNFENNFLKKFNMPIGVSLFAICSKN